jgi:hypothetical protein
MDLPLRIRSFPALALLALAPAACTSQIFDDGTSASGPGAGSPPACEPLPPPTCPDGNIAPNAGILPARPSSGGVAGSERTVLAISRLYFGDTDRSGSPCSGAWNAYGLDIDGKDTTVTSTDVCTPVAGASCQTPQDGENGIDNSFGANLLPIATTLVSTYTQTANESLTAGDSTLLIAVDGLGSAATYTSLPGTLLHALPMNRPRWDGTDVRAVDQASEPGVALSGGYMNNRVWVGAAPADDTLALDLHVTVQGQQLPPLPIHHVQISMQVAANGSSATSGTLSGIVTTADAAAWGAAWFAGAGPHPCDDPAVQSITQQIIQAADIMTDGTNGPGETCDAISIGLGFDAVAVQLGEAGAAPATFQECGATGVK